MNSPHQTDERALSLRVPGDLLSTNADALRTEAFALLQPGDGLAEPWTKFVLDLSSARMIDSVGLNLVVALLKRVQKRGARMQVVYSCPHVLRTFAFTRLDQHVEMVKV
jgi:anti-anti-sigma factor